MVSSDSTTHYLVILLSNTPTITTMVQPLQSVGVPIDNPLFLSQEGGFGNVMCNAGL